jgi:peptidylprolyl isomerase
VVKEGTGPVFTGNQYVNFDYLSYSTGSVTGAKVVEPQLIGASKFDGKAFGQAEIDSVSTADFCHALSGVREGSRVLVATPASNGAPDAVYLLDIRQIFLPHANGAVQMPTTGFPQVVRDPKTGQPGILAPVDPAPKDFKKATVIQGAGAQVKMGDTVMANYEVFIYSSKITDATDSNWTTAPVTPLPFKVTYGTGLIAGFVKSLEGSHVGDQVISIVPPALGYPTGRGSIPAGATLIFVIDVLGIVK